MNKWTGENITSVSPAQYAGSVLTGRLSLFAEIVKMRITVMVSFTTALGYFLGTGRISLDFIYPVIGIFLLACGSAALNQFQERKTDALMERTKNRPIPSGRVKAVSVFAISMSLLLLGSAVLILKTNITALSVGLITFFWYNGVYTLLKKKMALAIIPGSLVGALPPLAGWAASGAGVFDIKILYVGIYFFVWQIPHFWLLLLIHGEDFSRGGFPVLTDKMSRKSIVSVTFVMLLFTVLVSVAIPVFGIINYNLTYILLLVFSALMIYSAYRFFVSEPGRKDILKAFIGINIFTLIFIILLIADRMFFLTFIR